MHHHTWWANSVPSRDIPLGANLRVRMPHYAATVVEHMGRSISSGQAVTLGLLALDWFVMTAGVTAGLRTVQTGKLVGSSLQLPASGLIGTTLIFAGGLLLALSLRSIGWVPSSIVTRAIVAALVTIVVTDVPWMVAMLLTAARPDLHPWYRICFKGAQIAIGIDALTVLVVGLGGCLLLARQPRRLSMVIRSLILGAGAASGGAWMSQGAMVSAWSGAFLWTAMPMAAAAGLMYVIARRGHVDTLFTTREVLQLQELRQRYRSRGSV